MNARHLSLGLLLLVALACGVDTVQAEESWTPPGPAIGARFPTALNLPDQAGVKRDFATLQGEKGTVVVFVRSADWCSFCMAQLRDVNRRFASFRDLGWSVVAVSVDPVSEVAEFYDEQVIQYVMLADSDGAVVKSLGIRDPSYRPGKKEPGIPQPVIFAVDRKGIVRAKFAERGFRTRPDLDEVLAELGRLNSAG